MGKCIILSTSSLLLLHIVIIQKSHIHVHVHLCSVMSWQSFFTFVFHLLPKPTFGYFFVIHLSQVWNISTHFNSRCLKTSTATACFDALWKNMENNNYHVVTLVHLMWPVVSSCLFNSLHMNQIIPITLFCCTWKITTKQKMWCY